MNTGLRTPGIASPLQKRYLARSNKDSIVFRLRLTCIRVWWGVFTLICSHSLQHCSHVIHPSLARKRTGDAEIGWRPTPEKNIETMSCWGKNSPENCLVDLGRDTRTSTQSRRLVRRKGASWSLNWPSGANSLAHLQLKCILYVPL